MHAMTIDEQQLSPALDARIRRGLRASFPEDRAAFRHTRAWHGSAPLYCVIIEHDRRVIAHAAVVFRRVRVGDQQVIVAGPQNVFVLPSFRGRHLTARLIDAAITEARRRGAEAMLLFCVPQLAPLYARSGFVPLHQRITRTDPAGHDAPLPSKNIAMVLPLTQAPFPAGPVHLQGNDW